MPRAHILRKRGKYGARLRTWRALFRLLSDMAAPFFAYVPALQKNIKIPANIVEKSVRKCYTI